MAVDGAERTPRRARPGSLPVERPDRAAASIERDPCLTTPTLDHLSYRFASVIDVPAPRQRG